MNESSGEVTEESHLDLNWHAEFVALVEREFRLSLVLDSVRNILGSFPGIFANSQIGAIPWELDKLGIPSPRKALRSVLQRMTMTRTGMVRPQVAYLP